MNVNGGIVGAVVGNSSAFSLSLSVPLRLLSSINPSSVLSFVELKSGSTLSKTLSIGVNFTKIIQVTISIASEAIILGHAVKSWMVQASNKMRKVRTNKNIKGRH